MIDWRVTSTNDLISTGALEIGDGYRAKNAEFQLGGGLPFVRVKDVAASVQTSGLDELPLELLAVYGKKVSQPGDSLITMKGTVGRVAHVRPGDRRFVYSPQISYWRPLSPEVLHPRWLRYWLESPEFSRQALATKSATDMADYINLRDQRRMRITLPPFRTQERIAGVLASMDDLIENNRRRIEVLEEMAKAIYREWFVLFRYPGHEDVPLVDSDLGPIPEGWTPQPLSEVADLTMGQSPPSEHYNEDGLGHPFHQGVTDFGLHFPTTRKYCSVDGRRASKGDVLVSVRAPVGRLNLSPSEMVIGRGLASVRSRSGHQATLYRCLKHGVFAEEDAMGGGTIFKAISKKDLQNVMLLTPPPELAARMETVLADKLELIRCLTEQTSGLAGLRDLLLPPLVTGRIDVSELDLDELVGAVT